jgi:hypothetical protein
MRDESGRLRRACGKRNEVDYLEHSFPQDAVNLG